ncbi:MAG: tripartite tricarboxylate transporter substrate binding protein [Burkholderiaceae bacterium]|nr:tripartite tricarboxylate transporter substrate binding protein [Burkholderiaceae bacterium]
MVRFLSRRAALAAAAAALWGLASAASQAQAPASSAFPKQTIKVVVPYPAGGATDILARLFSQKLQEAWGVSVLVENRPGVGGTIGNNAVAKAAPDGHTVLMAITALIQQPPLMTLPYDPLKDFAPVSLVAKVGSYVVVPQNSPAQSLKDLVALVKANPGKYSYGSYGAGTSSHFQGALLNLQAGLDMVHVPFQGAAPLITNLVGGQLQAAFVDSASGRAHLKSFRPLAVTGTQRMAALPDVPTFQELGYHSFDPYGWFGLLLPAGTPEAIVARYAEEVNRILRLPDVLAKLESMGMVPGGGKPEDFAQTLRTDAGIYARIIKDANIKLTQ